MRIAEIYQEAVKRLAAANIPDAHIDAALLLCHLLKCNRAQLFLEGGQQVSPEHVVEFHQFLARRLRHEPLAYILGEQEFWSLSFYVSPDVLIPRPETEELLELALATVRKNNLSGPILELGTGSGVIAIVLALEIPGAMVYTLDRSLEALQVAAVNVRNHNVGDRVYLINSDWLAGIRLTPRFELIVSNPPYIAREVMHSLQPEVEAFEPHLALDGGVKGIESIERMTGNLSRILKRGGWFFMEIGSDQEEHVLNLFDSYKDYDSLKVHRDYAGHPRIFQARRK